MLIFFGLVTVTLMLGFASGQSFLSDATLIASRQVEVATLGRMYGIDLNAGTWKHEQSAICPAFSDYAFARYERDRKEGVVSSFIAIYSRKIGPAGKKPWHSGIILVPLVGSIDSERISPAERSSTVVAFNRIWSDELHNSSSQANSFPSLTWPALAKCYARFAGEKPIRDSLPNTNAAYIDLIRNPVAAMLTELKSSKRGTRMMYTEFNRDGMLVRAKVSETINP